MNEKELYISKLIGKIAEKTETSALKSDERESVLLRELEPTEKNKSDKESVAQDKWDRVRSEIENTADTEGYKIDKGIKDPVIALNAFEINTGQSCEGHIDSGMSAPWIRIEAPNEPEERFIGQNRIFEKVAKKYNMPVEETKRMFNADAYWEAVHEFSANGERRDFQKWKDESGILLYITKEILDDFYKNRQVLDNIKIKVDAENMEDLAEGSFEIFNGGDDHRDINGIELSMEERGLLSKRIDGYRKEMQVFAEFLKDKLFNGGEFYIKDKRIKAQEKVDQYKIQKVKELLKRQENRENCID